MAYIIGIATPKEITELKRRGWRIEDPPPQLKVDVAGAPFPIEDKWIMIYVDNDLFSIMDGDDWEKG